MPVFILAIPPKGEGLFEISPEDGRHLTKVLRVNVGDEFEVLLPDGQKAIAVLHPKGRRLWGQLKHLLPRSSFPLLPLWIGVAVIHWSRLEWLVEKATELGVTRLTPILFQRSRIPSCEKFSSHKLERLRKIARETLKQCERSRGLEIDPAVELKKFCKEVISDFSGQKILFNENVLVPRLEPSLLSQEKEQLILVGPEGGLTTEEIDLAEKSGFLSCSLGRGILRTETAALYGACIVKLLKGFNS